MWLSVWLAYTACLHQDRDTPGFGTDPARNSLVDIITHYSSWCGAINGVMSHLQFTEQADESIDEEYRPRDEDKWAWLSRAYWFAAVYLEICWEGRIAFRKLRGLPFAFPSYWSKLRSKPPPQQSLLLGHQRAFAVLCFSYSHRCPCQLRDKYMLLERAALTYRNACCDLQKNILCLCS